MNSDYFFIQSLLYSGALFAMVVPFVLLALAIPYAILRLRDAQGRESDPQLGVKIALHYFFSLALLILLAGLTVVVVDALMSLDVLGYTPHSSEQFPNSTQRTGAAMIVSGAVFIVLHLALLLTLTSDKRHSPTHRMFLGWRFAIHGLIVMATVTWLAILLFQRETPFMLQPRKVAVGMLLVWLPSWLFHLVLLRMASPRPRPSAADRRYEYGEEEDYASS